MGEMCRDPTSLSRGLARISFRSRTLAYNEPRSIEDCSSPAFRKSFDTTHSSLGSCAVSTGTSPEVEEAMCKSSSSAPLAVLNLGKLLKPQGPQVSPGPASPSSSSHSSHHRRRPRKSVDFSANLEKALAPGSSSRISILERSTAIYADEMFRFYAAILEWEAKAKVLRWKRRYDQSFRKLLLADAECMVEMYVEEGGPYENGCLSHGTKVALLSHLRNTSELNSWDVRDWFHDAKCELLRDIQGNPRLSAIVEEETGHSPVHISGIG